MFGVQELKVHRSTPQTVETNNLSINASYSFSLIDIGYFFRFMFIEHHFLAM